MSADTTMAILKTRRLNGAPGEFEYRVALVQAAENAHKKEPGWREEQPRTVMFEGAADDPCAGEVSEDDLHRWWYIASCFGKATVYYNARQARKVARRRCYRARKSGRIVEYGVKTLDLSDEVFPLAGEEVLEAALRKHRLFPFHDRPKMRPRAERGGVMAVLIVLPDVTH